MWISSDICVHTCARARESRRRRRSPSKRAPRGRAATQRHACTRTHETRRATAAGPRDSPVLVSDDQCVRSSSLNVRETLVAIKIRNATFAIVCDFSLQSSPARCRARRRSRTNCGNIADINPGHDEDKFLRRFCPSRTYGKCCYFVRANSR